MCAGGARGAGLGRDPTTSNPRPRPRPHLTGLIQADASQHFVYEVLEEIALTVQDALSGLAVPHCAFNGGRDVWVDVGNKALGIRALQAFFGVPAPHTLHVGDRFTQTGECGARVGGGGWCARFEARPA